MTLIINAAQIQSIYHHAENIYPEECCGILLGKIDKLTKTVIEVIPTANAWEQSESVVGVASPLENLDRTKTSRYTIPPQAIFQAQKRARDLQLNIIGFFHSHPDCPAIPSICDRDRAWDVYSYPIVSVMQGKVNNSQSWVLDRNGIFQEEEIYQVET
ncbi:M67 family metallopeptidase [Chamaesiphon minutus]|uniref:Putative metal-dependent protease of the PAD1/JAB1 superfamily n=1 Tax=Chamaesiphon minutus (strain ATCC 27169 / PCC 6605) TaxID=1173020 RepID=K9UKC4_CHAP6|nr:M67 family metallopeptidase [Chamaesiphon minutus]AFY95552.1 putative metal-dependent protease of the PAD1/JAB1 superfamily [Chamaesiphon minutus PCC 6605]